MMKVPIVKFPISITRASCLALAISLFTPVWSYALPTNQIFILHSYSQDYAWTRGQHEGFMQTLKANARVEDIVSTEYLDTKRRAYDETYAKEMASHLCSKYAGYKPAAIYVTDDNALLFARDHLSRVFPGVPVFFSGVNDYSVRSSLDPALFTGVFERKEVGPNIEWILQVDKNANDLIFVGDGSNTYEAIERELRSELIPYRLRVLFIAEKRLARALERLQDLPGKYLFLTTLGGMTDENGQVLSLRDIMKSLVSTGRIVISMEDAYIVEGVLGGSVTSGQKQGMSTARLLLAYQQGKPITDLPPILKSPNALIFDDRVLQQRRIDLPENLRSQAVLLHPRLGFYEQYRSLILGMLIGLPVLLLGVVTASFMTVSRKNGALSCARNNAESTNALLNRLAEQSRTVHWEVNAEGLYTYVSPVSYAVLGYRPEELVGKKHFYDLLLAGGRDTDKTANFEFFAQKRPFHNLEIIGRTKDRRLIWLITNGFPLLNGHGTFMGYYGFYTDINERKQTEEALRKSEEEAKRLAQENGLVAEVGRIISSTPNINEVFEQFSRAVAKLIPFDRIVVSLYDPQKETNFIRYAAGIDVPKRQVGDYLPLAGLVTAECIRTRSTLILQPKDAEEREVLVGRFPGMARSFVAGIRSIILVPLIAEDRIIGVLSLRSIQKKAYTDREARLTESIASQIAGAIANAQLFAERKEAEAALLKSEEAEKRLAQENAIVAEIGRIISSTLDIEEVYEGFAQEVKKIIPFDRISVNMINADDYTNIMTLVSGISIQDRPINEVRPLAGTATEEVWRTRSGLLIQAEKEEEIQKVIDRYPRLLASFQSGLRSMISVPLISRDEVIGVLHIRTNKPNAYSERDLKLAEKVGIQIAGAIANAHLFKERIRAEKEMADLREQFRQSQKMEAIGRLAGGIAHDFNNFLTVMQGHSQLALMGLKEGDPLRDSFEAIDSAATKSANLVRQLLAFSRRQVMQMTVLNLNILFRDLEKILRRLIGEDIELLTVFAHDLGRVKTDPGQIEQVLLNLAINAKDAMPQGGKLTIETANVELDEAYASSHAATKPGSYVMFSVTDTGVGMAPEVREQVFEPFFTTKEKGKGTGLGLATVYGIVKQSGGNIWVYSEPGQGATFKIYLPRVDAPLIKTVEKEVSGHFRGAGNRTILVVEDEEGVRKLVLDVLKKQGYSVLEAAAAEEAMLICQQHKDRIHLLLTDVVMPRMNGPELAKRLGSLYPEMKMLFMSGYAGDAIVHHGVLDEGVNYIQKPFTTQGLAKKVREILDS